MSEPGTSTQNQRRKNVILSFTEIFIVIRHVLTPSQTKSQNLHEICI